MLRMRIRLKVHFFLGLLFSLQRIFIVLVPGCTQILRNNISAWRMFDVLVPGCTQILYNNISIWRMSDVLIPGCYQISRL